MELFGLPHDSSPEEGATTVVLFATDSILHGAIVPPVDIVIQVRLVPLVLAGLSFDDALISLAHPRWDPPGRLEM
jgi:hypothetical protein